MTPDKMSAARAAVDRLIYDLLDKEDELFFVEFATRAEMTQGWTKDRQLISRAVKRVEAAGGTAIYDAVAMAIPTAQSGTNRKKAILVISDGNDTNSSIAAGELRQRIRESDVLVYALGIDGTRSRTFEPDRPPVQIPLPIPFPFPAVVVPSLAFRPSAEAAVVRRTRALRAPGSTPTRCVSSPTTPAAAPRSCAGRAGSGRRRRGSPTN
jgi:hypothetical protein